MFNNSKETLDMSSQFDELLSSQKKIIVFGAGILGHAAVSTLQYFNKTIACICDNDVQKQGTVLSGIPVVSPSEAVGVTNNATIFVCVFNDANFKAISDQLMKLGFKDIMDYSLLFWAYQMKIMKRNISSETLETTLKIVKEKEKNTVLGNISVVITEKCSLRCIDCGVLIPYYANPKHHDKTMVIESIRRLAAAVDAIENLTIIGGEPFLHHDIVEICQAASNIDNILRVTLTTNGSILLKDTIVQQLKSALFSVTISDYGTLSRHKNELMKSFEEIGICYDVLDDSNPWSKQNMPIAQNRGRMANDLIFSECFWIKAAGKLMNGQYHLCDFSAAITPFNGIPNNKNDYIDVMDNDLTVEGLRDKIKWRINSKDCLQACDYCLIYKLPPTQRAKQTSETIVFEGAGK